MYSCAVYVQSSKVQRTQKRKLCAFQISRGKIAIIPEAILQQLFLVAWQQYLGRAAGSPQ